MSKPRPRRWHWQATVAALMAFLAVQGQPVAASYTTTGPGSRTAETTRRLTVTSVPTHRVTATDATVQGVAADARPDFRVAFESLDEAQAGQAFSYTIQVRNAGGTAGVASVSAVVPPEVSNVRVTAPGFVCTRRITPSGAEAGTLVTCLRNDLDAGSTAEVTIEANAPSTAGTYQLTAVADPRNEVAEADEGNNAADTTVTVRG